MLVKRARLKSRHAAGVSALVLIASSVLAVPSVHAAGATSQVTFSYTGAAQTWSIPAGVQSVAFEATGGFGGGMGAATVLANMLSGTLTFPSGATTLEINVGGNGANQSTTGAGGWNGGGNGGGHSGGGFQVGAGGGGATDIRLPGAPASQALVVAGGGGGFGGNGTNLGSNWYGGPGGAGGLQPQAGTQGNASGSGSDGGAGGAGGAVSGAVAGDGQFSSNGDDGAGGGGGGGWNSGAGGSAGTADKVSLQVGAGGGGGGGQSYASPTYVTQAADSINGGQYNPGVTISYLTVTGPATKSLTAGQFAAWTYDAGSGATHSVESGALPPGMSLDGSTGVVSGTPMTSGTYTVTVASSKLVFVGGKATTTTTTTVTVTASGPAVLTATSATAVTATTATANGIVTANSAPVTGLQCTYTPSGGSSQSVPASPSSAPAGTTPVSVSCPLTGLQGNQQYTYTIDGQQGGNVGSGSATFKTSSSPPSVTTSSASGVASTTATGNGTVSATQNVTSIECRVATTAAGVATGTSFAASPALTTGVVTDQAVTCAMTGLTADTHYYYAFFATDSVGTSSSPTYASFVTRQAPPSLGVIAASNVGTSTATITGSVSATNERVTSIYCRAVPSPGDPSNGAAVVATPFTVPATAVDMSVTCALSGLSSGTKYVARMYATDPDGTSSSGNEATFTTSTPPPPGPGPAPEPAPPTPPAPTTPSSPSAASTPSTPTAPSSPPQLPTALRPIVPGIYAVRGATKVPVQRPATSRLADAPIVRMPLDSPTALAVRGLSRPGTQPVWAKGATGPWRRAGETTVNQQGRATLPALLVSKQGTYDLRIGGSRPSKPSANAAYVKVVVLSTARR